MNDYIVTYVCEGMNPPIQFMHVNATDISQAVFQSGILLSNVIAVHLTAARALIDFLSLN